MNVIDGKMFRAMLRSGAVDLKRHCEEVNSLNVFPIPDGDTGVNMLATIGGGVEAADATESDSLGECVKALSRGSLLSARGNSGVILSQFFSGLADPLSHFDQVNVMQFAQAFESGVKHAYEVVVKPVEGTILTVMREGGHYAMEQLNSSTSFEEYFTCLVNKMRATLMTTPDLLPTLKEAGVIDSGGAGLLYIIEGMAQALGGKIIEDVSLNLSDRREKMVVPEVFDENSTLDYGYCTEFILQLTNDKNGPASFNLEKAIIYFSSVGDSLVAFRDGTLVKVHVHTKTPDQVISYALRYGEFVRFKMENMTLQHHQTVIDKSRSISFLARPENQHKKMAVVAVAPNKEVAQVFEDCGVDEIVSGSKLMNPKAEDFVEAIRKADADDVFVLPNNKNEIMVANIAAELCTTARVHVLPSSNIAEGFSCFTVLDFADLSVEDNLSRANAVLAHPNSLIAYRATRDTTVDGVEVHEGEAIIQCGDALYHADTLDEAFQSWASERINGEESLFMAFYGKGVSDETQEAMQSLFEENNPFMEVRAFDGGDMLYDMVAILD